MFILQIMHCVDSPLCVHTYFKICMHTCVQQLTNCDKRIICIPIQQHWANSLNIDRWLFLVAVVLMYALAAHLNLRVHCASRKVCNKLGVYTGFIRRRYNVWTFNVRTWMNTRLQQICCMHLCIYTVFESLEINLYKRKFVSLWRDMNAMHESKVYARKLCFPSSL